MAEINLNPKSSADIFNIPQERAEEFEDEMQAVAKEYVTDQTPKIHGDIINALMGEQVSNLDSFAAQSDLIIKMVALAKNQNEVNYALFSAGALITGLLYKLSRGL